MTKKIVEAVVDALLIKARALKPVEVRPLRFDPVTAKKACVRGLDLLRPHEEVIEKDHPGFDFEALVSLPELCDRLLAAQGDHAELARARDRSASALLSECQAWRRKLMPLADSLSESGKVDAGIVHRIHQGRGTRDQVADVLALAKLLAPFASLVDAATELGALNLATDIATRARVAFGTATRDEPGLAAAADLRDRYATLIVNGHARLRMAAAAVTSRSTAASMVPALRRSRSKVAQPEPVEPAPV